MSNPVMRMHLYAARSSDVTAPLIYMCFTWLIYQVAVGSSRSVTAPIPKGNLTMTHHGTAVLNCSAVQTGPNVQVTWYRMNDGIQVSHNQHVVHSLKERITVQAEGSNYNLRISPVVFPEDHGAWRCAVFNSTEPVQETNLNVIAPPEKAYPAITPAVGLVQDLNNEGFVYTCSSPPANPPVTLHWEEQPRPTTVDELERLIVDSIMDSQGITAMLQSVAAAQQSMPQNGAPPMAMLPPKNQNNSPGQPGYPVPNNVPTGVIPEGIDPALVDAFAANPETIPDEYKHLVPQGGIPPNFQYQPGQQPQGQPGQQPQEQPGAPSGYPGQGYPAGGIPQGYEDMIPDGRYDKIPEGYRRPSVSPPPTSREQPLEAPTTVARASQEQDEEARYAPYIKDGYSLPEEYKGRFPPGFEHLLTQFLVKDPEESDGGAGAEEDSTRRRRRTDQNSHPARHQTQQGYQQGYQQGGQSQQGYPQSGSSQQQGYPQQGYYPQGGQSQRYPQGSQPQQGYPQGSQPLQGYQQGGYQMPHGYPAPNNQPQYGQQSKYPNPNTYPQQGRSASGQGQGAAMALSSLDPLLIAELIHGTPDLTTLRQLAKITGRDASEIPTRDDLQSLLESFEKEELAKYEQFMDFEPLPTVGHSEADGAVSSSAKLILTPLNHGRVYSCVAEHPAFNGQKYSKNLLFAIADKKMAEKGFEAPFDIPVQTMGAGDVGIIVVLALILLVAILAGCVLIKLRHRWNLDVRTSSGSSSLPHTYLPISQSERNGDVNNAPKTNNNATIATIETPDTRASMRKRRERKICIIKMSVAGFLMLILLILMTLIIPVYIKPFNVPVKGVDQIVTVMAGAQVWLDCSSGLKRDVDHELVQLAWRKNFTKFYTQYPSTLESDTPVYDLPAIGRASNTETGQQMASRVTDHSVLGQIGMNPATESDQGFYMCETVRMNTDTGALMYRRKTFVVAVLGEMSLNYALISIAAVGIVISGCLILLLCYHSIKCHTPIKKGDDSHSVI